MHSQDKATQTKHVPPFIKTPRQTPLLFKILLRDPLMLTLNPNLLRIKTVKTLATIATCMTCLLTVSPSEAQVSRPASSLLSNQLFTSFGGTKNARIYKPTQPTADRLTSNPPRFTRPVQVPDSKVTNTIRQVRTPVGSHTRNLRASANVDAGKTVPPTVVVRPSAAYPNHQNDCIVEINETESSNGVSLRVAVPDSVSMIEVIPNRESGARRNFRIKMEQGVETELAQLPAPATQREPQSDSAEQRSAQSVDRMPKGPLPPVPGGFPTGYSKNPFFVEHVAQPPLEEEDEPLAETSSPATTVEEDVLPEQKIFQNPTGVREFLQRTSHVSSDESFPKLKLEKSETESETEPTAEPKTETAGDKPELHTPTHNPNLLRPKSIVAARIIGPREIDVSQTADYVIAIINPMNAVNRNLEIQLDVPKGLKVVLLGQAAQFNPRTRTLKWSISEIQPGEEIQLGYRVKSLRSGKQRQRVEVRIQDELMDRHEIFTLGKINVDVGVGELPFD